MTKLTLLNDALTIEGMAIGITQTVSGTKYGLKIQNNDLKNDKK